jgi:hypothetical protein
MLSNVSKQEKKVYITKFSSTVLTLCHAVVCLHCPETSVVEDRHEETLSQII